VAGYSDSPLTRKLGIRSGSTLVIIGAPDSVIFDLPPGVKVRRQARGSADVVVSFFTQAARLRNRAEALSKLTFPDGGLWIVWPKRSSGIATDITDHVVRDAVIPLGLVDNKICAVDEVWTGLRVVWRRENRH
jgi:hypothetical protein